MVQDRIQSRTTNSIRNSAVAMFMYFTNLILQFYSRKIFLDYLGTEILGLNTTLNNLLQFLNLAELGVGSAIGCTLYKPIAEKDYVKINDIVSLQGIIYKTIAVFVLGGSVILGCFFPVIFEKTDLPLWYAYASFIVLLVGSLLGYFVNYRQIILSANQQEYKIQYTYKLSMSIKLLVQIIAMKVFSNAYVWWLILEFLFAIFASIFLNREIAKSAPYLKKSNKDYHTLKKIHPEVFTKVRQMFFHKVAGFALMQLSPLIIYAYTTLTVVAIYGNYMIIYLGIISLSNAAFNGINGSIGNLLHTASKGQIYKVFNELLSIRFFLAFLFCYIFYLYATPFVSLWIGKEYALPPSTLLLMVGILFINLIRQTIENYINSLGLFKDIWAPITEMSINILLSILFGYYWGLNGVLFGIICSLIPIVVIWKPIFLFHWGLNLNIKLFWSPFFINTSFGMISVALSLWVQYKYNYFCDIANMGQLILSIILSSLIFISIQLCLMKVCRSPIFETFRRLKRCITL